MRMLPLLRSMLMTDVATAATAAAAAAAAAAAGLYVDHLGNKHTLCPQHSTSNAREVKRVISMGGTIVNGRVSAAIEGMEGQEKHLDASTIFSRPRQGGRYAKTKFKK